MKQQGGYMNTEYVKKLRALSKVRGAYCGKEERRNE